MVYYLATKKVGKLQASLLYTLSCFKFVLLTQKLAGLFQSDVNMRADVIRGDKVVETRLLELLVQFGADTGKDDMDAVLLIHTDKIGKIVDAR